MSSRRGALALGALLLLGCTPAAATGQQAAPGVALPTAPPAAEPASIPPGRVPPTGDPALGWDILHYDIEIALPTGPGWIAGRTTIQALRTAPAGSLALDLVGLAVTDVRVDRRVVGIDQREGKLIVATGGGRAGDTLQVEITYAGTPDDGLVLQQTTGGKPSAFVDNWPDRARFWFPSVDHPADKATASYTVHAPAAWQVIANGAPVGPAVRTAAGTGGPAGDRRTWRWRTDVPIPTYTMVIGATELAVDTVGTAACGNAPAAAGRDRCVEVTTWLYAEDRAKAAPSFARSARMVQLMSEWIGPFPYEKLAHVQSSTRFGGMENAAAIFYDEKGIAAGRNIEGTVAHETAHQWFGDSVTEAEWRHLWLSEGFATYFGALFYEWADGTAAFRSEMSQERRGYLGSAVVDRPVIDPEADDLFGLLNANNYQKGAWVLHMLRGVVGDSAFQAGIRAYYDKHKNGTALTADLRTAMERASGADLRWFFGQWLEQPGHPILRVTPTFEATNGQVVVMIEQIQRASWPRFRTPLTLVARGPWGERRLDVELTGARTLARFPADAPADSVTVDPDGWVLLTVEGEAAGAR